VGDDAWVREVLASACLYAADWIRRLNRWHRGCGINPGVDLASVLKVGDREEFLMDPLIWTLEEEKPSGGP
jgi:hypothetical protein